MIVGIPKELKNNEFRVGMIPSGIEQLSKAGHEVLVEESAGLGIGISDSEYALAGARIVKSHEEIFEKAEMIVKVKEPLPCEHDLVRAGQIVFTFFHFAASRSLTEKMLERKIIAIAYETVKTDDGRLPLLIPMSEIAGRIAVQEGAKYLEKPMMGKGVLLGGVPGVAPAKVVILGGGTVGANSAKMAAGLGADVTVMDINLERLRYLDDIMPKNVTTLMYNKHNLKNMLISADLVIGAILIPAAKAPKVIRREMLKLMQPGSVIIDVAVDQGGCIETCRPTTHSDPIFIEEGIIHYCVANMPGAVAQTSSYALTNVTLPYIIELAQKGYQKAAIENKAIAAGVNMIKGKLTCEEVGKAFDLEYYPRETLLVC